MASQSQGIRAGKAFVELSADDSGLKAGLAKAREMVLGFSKTLAGVGGGIAGAGGAILAPILASFQEAIGRITDVRKAAEQLGSTTESVSAMAYAAQKAGVDLEGLEHATRHLDKAIVEAADGSGAAADLFKQMGIDAKQLEELPLEEKFKAIASGLQGLPNETERQAAAMELLGKSGVNLIPILRGGAGGLQELFNRAKNVGAIVSTEDAQKAKQYTAAIGQAREAVKYFWESVGMSLLDVVGGAKEASDNFVGFLRQAREFVENNRSIIITVAAVAGSVVGLGTALVALGGFFAAATVAASGLMTVLGILTSTPVLIAVALGGATAALIEFTKSATGTGGIAGVLGDLGETFSTTMGGVKDAMQAGDWELAFETVVAGLKLIWQSFIDSIFKSVQALFSSLVKEKDALMADSALVAGKKAGEESWTDPFVAFGKVVEDSLQAEGIFGGPSYSDSGPLVKKDGKTFLSDADVQRNENIKAHAKAIEEANKKYQEAIAEIMKANPELEELRKRLADLREQAAGKAIDKRLKGLTDFANFDFGAGFGGAAKAMAALAQGSFSAANASQVFGSRLSTFDKIEQNTREGAEWGKKNFEKESGVPVN